MLTLWQTLQNSAVLWNGLRKVCLWNCGLPFTSCLLTKNASEFVGANANG